MASNLLISLAALFYSVLLVSDFMSHPPSIIDLINNISHLLSTKPTAEDKAYDYTHIYADLMKWIFLNSVVFVFLSTATIFASFSSFRELTLAMTRQWKPLSSSIVMAVVFTIMLLPTISVGYFVLALCHAYFVVYCSLKFITMPMLEEKFVTNVPGEIGQQLREAERKRVSRNYLFSLISLSAVQFGKSFFSSEAYGAQVVVGVGYEVAHMIWLVVVCYEIMPFLILNRENKKKVDDAGIICSEKVTSGLTLSDESLP